MWAIIIEAIVGAFRGIFGAKKAEPTTADLAAQAATADTQLQNEVSAHENDAKAATTRTAADTAVVRAVTDAPGKPVVDAAVNNSLAAKFPGQFRD